MAITAGSNLNSVAAPQAQTLASNYIDFTSTGIKVGRNNIYQI